MIQQMKIRNFKCFDRFDMSHLAPITMIGGKNNVGKSSILEAFLVQHVMLHPNYFSFLMNLHNEVLSQNTLPHKVWDHLFHNLGESDAFEIEYERTLYQGNQEKNASTHSTFTVSKLYDSISIFQDAGMSSLMKQSYESANLKRGYSSIHLAYDSKKYKFSGNCTIQNNAVQFRPDEQYMPTSLLSGYSFPSWPFENMIIFKNAASISGIVEWLSRTILENEKKELLIHVLQMFDSDIVSISPVIESGNASIYVTLKHKNSPERYLSLNHMGDGMNKAFQLLLAILNLPNGILLIDEFENGLHYELYEEILTVIFETARKVNCQIILTTHSRDLVEAALASMGNIGHIDDLCYQRIDVTKEGERKAYVFQGDGLRIPFDENLEIR